MFKMKALPRTLAGLAMVAALPLSVLAQAKDPVKVGDRVEPPAALSEAAVPFQPASAP